MIVLGTSSVGLMLNETANASLGTAKTSCDEKLPLKMSSVTGGVETVFSVDDSVTAGDKIVRVNVSSIIAVPIIFFMEIAKISVHPRSYSFVEESSMFYRCGICDLSTILTTQLSFFEAKF